MFACFSAGSVWFLLGGVDEDHRDAQHDKCRELMLALGLLQSVQVAEFLGHYSRVASCWALAPRSG